MSNLPTPGTGDQQAPDLQAGAAPPQRSHPGESQPPQRKWLVIGGVVVVAAILLFALWRALASPGGQPAPGTPFVTIIRPDQGAVLPSQQTVTVSGQAGGLPENNLIVRALDSAGNVLLEQPAMVSTTEVGGTGEWKVDLVVPAEAGTPGMVFVFSPSPADGSIVASASIEVTFGDAPEVEPPDTPSPEPPPGGSLPGAELIGPLWTLEQVLPLLSQPTAGVVTPLQEPAEGTTITLLFKEDKTLEANGGCNEFTGRYEVNNTEIKLLDIVAQELPSTCETPEGTMDQEAHFIALLQRSERFYVLQQGNDKVLKLLEVREAENDLEQPLLEFKD